MPTKTTTMDMWVGRTTVTTSLDMLLQATRTKTTDLDMYVYRGAETTIDMFIVDERGSFRGTMTTAERDATEAVQPGDVFIVTDPT